MVTNCNLTDIFATLINQDNFVSLSEVNGNIINYNNKK